MSKYYWIKGSQLCVLADFDFIIPDGEFTVLVGPSGCGKTTVLRISAGLEKVDRGTVTIDGELITGPGRDRAVVFQQLALMPWRSVRRNIAYPMECAGFTRTEIRNGVDYYLELVGLSGFADALPGQLSGGMKQRVAIARSYAQRPKVLLMDEPFSALDAQTRLSMQEELVRIYKREQVSVLFITHNVEEALVLGDRVAVMASREHGIVETIDIREAKETEEWASMTVEDIMALDSFRDMRRDIQGMLR